MGFLSDAMQVPDPILLRNGQEAQFQIVKAVLTSTSGKDRETGDDKPVRPMINVMLKCISEQNIEPVFFRMIGDLEDDSEESKGMRDQERKNFARAFAIDPAVDGDAPMEQYTGQPQMEPVPIPGWNGKTGWATVGVKEYGGRESNEVTRFTVPK